MTTAAVHCENLSYQYPGRGGFRLMIDQVRVERGATVACVGASGCGKTTLINLIAGVLVPAAGSIRVGDITMSDLGETARRNARIEHIGMVFQEFELLEYLSALGNILLPYRLSSVLRETPAVRTRARMLARTLGVDQVLGRKPARLSQGERQRVAVCRALITEPQLVIADEPTGNLDPENADGVIELLVDSVRASGSTLLVVTHNHALLDRFDSVIHLDKERAS